MTMIGEGSKNQIEEEGASFLLTTAKEPQGALRSPVLPPPATTGTPIARSSSPSPSPPLTLCQAEEGHGAAMKESVEQCHTTKAKSHLQLGGMVAVFGLAVLSSWLCLPKDAKHPNNVGFTFSLLLTFATFLSGNALMLLSMHMLERLESLVSGGQRVVSKCLIVVCTALPIMTLVSLLALLPSMLYMCLGLTVITAVVLPVVTAYCYLRRRAEGGDKEELDAASKITS